MTQNFINTTQANNLYPVANATTTSVPFVDVYLPRPPTDNDTNYPIQKKWLDTSNGDYWLLEGFSSAGANVTAIWIKIGSINHTESITGNIGPPVFPTGFNINVVGDGTNLTTVGNPGTSTLTIETAGGIPTLFTENTGTAVASSGNLNILGTQGVATTGSGDTVTVVGQPAKAASSSSLTNLGTASFNNTDFSVDSNGYVSTLGSFATAYDANSGSAIPSLGILNILGTAGITTAGSGNTITINGSETVSSIHMQVFTSSGTYTPTTGMLYCNVLCLGGGGGGGGALSTGNISVGSGGGGGEYAVGLFSAATIGATQTITIGAAGTGTLGSNGTTGGTTSFGSLISCFGGSGGLASPGAIGGQVQGGLGGTGGTGGNYRTIGSTGDYGFFKGDGTVPLTLSGNGANSQLGAGGVGLGASAPGSNDGGAAGGYGAGGGGAIDFTTSTQQTGGNGTAGIIIITEYVG